MVGGGWLELEPGETTDDTALTKAVLAGYGGGPLDLRRVRDAMLSWQDTLPKDIGKQTRKALDYLRGHPDALSLPEDPDAQGNGAVIFESVEWTFTTVAADSPSSSLVR